jgi:hypothetical protein
MWPTQRQRPQQRLPGSRFRNPFLSGRFSGHRHTDGFEPLMGAAGTRLQAIEKCAGSLPGKVPVRVAGISDPAHCCLERRILNLEMNAEARLRSEWA